MRIRFALTLLAGLCLLLAGLWFGGAFDRHPALVPEPETAPGTVPVPPLPNDTPDPARAADPGKSQGPAPEGRGTGSESSSALPASLLLCVDATNDAPLGGVMAFDLEARRSLGQSDETGRLELRGWQPERVAFHGPGLLARMPDEREIRTLRAASEPVHLPIHVDRYTWPVRFEFGSGAAPAGPLHLLVARADGQPEHARDFPTIRTGPGRRVEPELQRAWEQHLWLVTQLPSTEQYYLARPLPITVTEPAAFVLRFGQAGSYRFRVFGGAAEQWIGEVTTPVTMQTQLVRLPLREAAVLTLHVQAPGGAPIAGASVTVQAAHDRRMPTRRGETDAEGHVRFDGLFPGEVQRLAVLADGYAAHDAELAPGGRPVQITLQPLPSRTHELLVVERGTGRPISGARLLIGDPGLPASESSTDAHGRGRIELVQGGARVLEVRHDAYLTWRELLQVETDGLPARVPLVPAERDDQLAAGLIAVVRGVVRDAEGRPLAGERVILDYDAAPLGAAGARQERVVLAGKDAPQQLLVMTGQDGRYELFTTRPGPVPVVWQGLPGGRRSVHVMLGREHDVDFGGR